MSAFEQKEKVGEDIKGGDEQYEKAGLPPTAAGHVVTTAGVGGELYDPYKESVWTRLGLTFESFKRAPGTTG